MSTTITVVGNLTADPELQFTPAGAARCTFTIAETERILERETNTWKDGHTNFVRVVLWRADAENAAESLVKGTRVVATGKLVIRNFERQDGTRGTSVELQDAEVGASLRYATAKVTRTQRNSAPAAGQQPATQAPPAAAQAPQATAPAVGTGATALSGDLF